MSDIQQALLSVGLIGLVLAAWACVLWFSASQEAAAYNRITGANVTAGMLCGWNYGWMGQRPERRKSRGVMTDEELAEIAARVSGVYSSLWTMEAYERDGVPKLFAEIRRLRDENERLESLMAEYDELPE
jgi:hypothetical protein